MNNADIHKELCDETRGGMAMIVTTIVSAIAAFALLAVTCGCVYKGGKVTEGTDLAVGLNVPMSEGCLQLQVLNYLSGFRVGVDRNAAMTIKYTVSETNDYFGCIHTRVTKSADVTIEPCETNACETNQTTSATTSAPIRDEDTPKP